MNGSVDLFINSYSTKYKKGKISFHETWLSSFFPLFLDTNL